MTEQELEAIQEELRYGFFLKNMSPLDTSKFEENRRRQFESYRELTHEHLGLIPKKEGVLLAFDFYDSLELNGLAFMRTANDLEFRFATVAAGAILYFHEFFSYIMSRVDVLPSIGVVTAEKNLPYAFVPPRKYPVSAGIGNRALLRDVNPANATRLEFAQIMAVAASRFLILHEIGHCIHGHVNLSPFALHEFDQRTVRSKTEVLMRHTLEMDADSYATNHVLRSPFSEIKSKPSFCWGNELKAYPPSKFLYPTLLAIALHFRLFARPETLPIDQGRMLEGTHPHPSIRNHFVGSNAITLAYHFGLDNPNHNDKWIAKLAVKSARDAAQIWERLTRIKEPDRLLQFDDTSAKTGMDRVGVYLNDLLESWHNLKPRLAPFALVPLAPSKYEIPPSA